MEKPSEYKVWCKAAEEEISDSNSKNIDTDKV